MSLEIIWVLAFFQGLDPHPRLDQYIPAFKHHEFCEASRQWMAARDQQQGAELREYRCIQIAVTPPEHKDGSVDTDPR